MKKLISRIIYLYDFMYYRIATSWYSKSYNNLKVSFFSSAIVTIAQFFIFFDIVGTIYLSQYSVAERKSSLHVVTIVMCILALIHIQLNHRKYNSKFDEYKLRWGNLDEKKRDKLDLIVILIAIIPLIWLPILTNLFDFTK